MSLLCFHDFGATTWTQIIYCAIFPFLGLLEEAKNGNVQLGGCCPEPEKNSYCKKCEISFNGIRKSWF